MNIMLDEKQIYFLYFVQSANLPSFIYFTNHQNIYALSNNNNSRNNNNNSNNNNNRMELNSEVNTLIISVIPTSSRTSTSLSKDERNEKT